MGGGDYHEDLIIIVSTFCEHGDYGGALRPKI